MSRNQNRPSTLRNGESASTDEVSKDSPGLETAEPPGSEEPCLDAQDPSLRAAAVCVAAGRLSAPSECGSDALASLELRLNDASPRIPHGPVIEILHDKVILWVSLTPKTGLVEPQPSFPAGTRRFPVVFDPPFNDCFLLNERHLREWARLDPNSYVRTRSGPLVPVSFPFPGFVVLPAEMGFPRLPLLGMRALRQNRFVSVLEGFHGHLTVDQDPPSPPP